MDKEKFICSFCGKEHEDLRSRIKCEYSCLQRIELEEQKEKEAIEKQNQQKKIEEMEEQIKYLIDNEKSLYNEYLSTVERRKKLQKTLAEIKYGNKYTKIQGFPLEFFLF